MVSPVGVLDSVLDENFIRRRKMTASELALIPTKSTRHIHLKEREDGIGQMLRDLEMLARIDGCIAAAWALEFLTEIKSANT